MKKGNQRIIKLLVFWLCGHIYFYVKFYGMTYGSYTDDEYKQQFWLSFTTFKIKEENRE